MKRHRKSALLGAIALAAGTVVAAFAVPGSAGAATTTVAVQVPQRLCATSHAGQMTCDAIRLVTKRVTADQANKMEAAGVARPATVRPNLAFGLAGGYSPPQLAKAYGVNAAASTTQTVAIVDAYQDPSVGADLNHFDTQYGLPNETTAGSSWTFKVVNQSGGSDLSGVPTDVGWSGEISLDVQAVRGMCNKCRILLVEANDNNNPNLAAGVDYAAGQAKIVSNSYGGPEAPSDPQVADYNHPGVAILASTGDDGWYGWDHINVGVAPDDAPSVPSGYNTVIAVGGTTLNLNPDGSRADETVWNDNGPYDASGNAIGQTYGFAAGAAGGGCSSIYSPQLWQQKVAGYASLGCGSISRSGVDIAAEADYFTGFDIYETTAWCVGTDGNGNACPASSPGWETIGGTSLASPLIAALWGLAGGPAGVRYPALTLYGHFRSDASHLYDVTVGGNGACDTASPAACAPFFGGGNVNLDVGGWVDCAWDGASLNPISPKPYQCYANKGYDGVSGVGTPKGVNPFKPMSPKAVISKPSSIVHGHSASFSGSRSSSPFPGGSITSYKWSWGDGHSSTGKTATHTYAAKGTFHVTLTVSDNYTAQNHGRTGKQTITITVT